MQKISIEVMRALDAAIVRGATLTLQGQMDRKLYAETNKVIEAAGGKWDRRARAHVFSGEALEAIEPILLTGSYSRTKQDFGQFDTPEPLADEVVTRAGIMPGMTVLEPSAGIGRMAAAARRAGAAVTCWEIDARRAEPLRAIADSLTIGDFLAAAPAVGFDRVVMNPPFARQDDIRHVMHAHRFLAPGGFLVAIMSAGVQFRENRLSSDFRAFVEAQGGAIEPLPDGSFRESGTHVATCLVTLPA
ncbi:hypothetical protein BJF92_12040 [Rhizobium rhizosphaerae]|uniref:Methyltransferase small domain-containing protein n=1 Tax=Xaviernesmea rhizosphaerae TaxID=1672749 RepID=A0A1Q9AN81_9HYPH|nr:methyltransferase [Xaviernesmea rhizosphaerae]OLP56796.1 hypothetical protein BJF92_12040 [Xaviernesmea rhizosphaerae]